VCFLPSVSQLWCSRVRLKCRCQSVVQPELCGTCAYTCVGFLRYLHYYQRYHGHESALKYAAAQRAQAEARMVEQQEAQKTSWIDVQFLKQAAEQVRISCVTTLCLRCGWKLA
jgi:hypothetical protein